MGDFNCNLMFSNDSNASMFLNLVHSYCLESMYTLPTRITAPSATLLDTMLTNVSNHCTPGILLDDISDHFPIFAFTDISSQYTSSEDIPSYSRKFTQRSISYFNTIVSNETWQDVYNEIHADNAFNKFYDVFLQYFETCFPKTTNRKGNIDNSSKSWITSAIENSCKTKQKLYKRYVRNRTNENFEAYKTFRNRLTSVVRCAKNYTIMKCLFIV